MRLRVRRPNRPSRGAVTIARATGARLLRREGSRFRPRPSDIVINWGNPEPYQYYTRILNHPTAVAIAIDKVRTWDCLELHSVPTVMWTTDWLEAREWLRAGDRCFVRTKLQSHGGAGMSVYSEEGTDHSLPAGNFEEFYDSNAVYVKVFGRNPLNVDEYRAHVVGNEVIDLQQKKRSSSYEGISNPYIRSHGNGWNFCREGIEHSDAVVNAAVACVQALGLDFGAVDIGHERGTDSVCVYECNSAPGLEGSTPGLYADSLLRYSGANPSVDQRVGS